MVNIISIHFGIHDSSAALFSDYRVVAAIQRERLTREKKAGGAPKECIDEVLSIGALSHSDIDVVVFSRAEFPRSLFKTGFFRKIRDNFKGKSLSSRDLSTVMIKAGTSTPEDVLDIIALLKFYGLPTTAEIMFSNHHYAHALPSLFFTDWEDALLYTADGAGDNVNYSHRIFKDGEIRTLFGDDHWLHKPYRIDSLARAYANVTEALGFKPLHHEGKITGLAAYGKPTLKADFQSHFSFDKDGLINSDFPNGTIMREQFMALCDEASREDAAASIQEFVEDMIVQSVGRLMETQKVRKLGLAGGLFANVKLNQRLTENGGVDEVFVVPPMGDEGLVIGGPLQYLLGRDGLKSWLDKRHRLDDVYWGRGFGSKTASRILGFSDKIEKLDGDPVETSASLLKDGKAIAIVSQRMEFGPRALGARTIMASPERRDINESLNTRLDRSEFMPFAPVVAEEDARDVFDVTAANAYASRFMTITCDVKPEWAHRIPAVVHVDNTARPQIIRRDDNPLYYGILGSFKALTGLPVAVNTSFNVHEEPIVNTPEEAAQALVDDRIDYIATDDGVFGVKG
jgi:carbamoyltransferase